MGFELDKFETSTTKTQIMIYNIMIIYATGSILIASFANSGFSIAMSGWVYSGIGPTIFLYLKLKK